MKRTQHHVVACAMAGNVRWRRMSRQRGAAASRGTRNGNQWKLLARGGVTLCEAAQAARQRGNVARKARVSSLCERVAQAMRAAKSH